MASRTGKGKNKIVSIVVEMVPTISLVPSPFNPPERTARKNLDDLRHSIEIRGFDPTQPIVLGKDGVLGDGNRRLACAIDLGIEFVPVLQSAVLTGAELWSLHNGTVRAPTVKEMTVAVAKGAEIPEGRSGKWVSWFVQRFGRVMLDYISERGMSATCIKHVTTICGYVGEANDGEFASKTVRWLADHKGANHTARIAIAMGVSPLLLRDKILENKPLKIS